MLATLAARAAEAHARARVVVIYPRARFVSVVDWSKLPRPTRGGSEGITLGMTEYQFDTRGGMTLAFDNILFYA